LVLTLDLPETRAIRAGTKFAYLAKLLHFLSLLYYYLYYSSSYLSPGLTNLFFERKALPSNFLKKKV